MLRPPLEIGPVSVFLLILSGLKFHMKGKMTLLTSLAKSVGVSSTEQVKMPVGWQNFIENPNCPDRVSWSKKQCSFATRNCCLTDRADLTVGPAGLKCRSQVTGQVTGQLTGHTQKQQDTGQNCSWLTFYYTKIKQAKEPQFFLLWNLPNSTHEKTYSCWSRKKDLCYSLTKVGNEITKVCKITWFVKNKRISERRVIALRMWWSVCGCFVWFSSSLL